MRDIKFRGLDQYKTWMYGFLCPGSNGKLFIVTPSNSWEVDPKTVGQYTGLKDKNGVEIYDGDILNTKGDKNMVVCWVDRFSSFCLEKNGWMHRHFFGEAVEAIDCEIIGNIHSNPELLNRHC